MSAPKGYTTKDILEGILQRTFPASAIPTINLLISTAEDMIDDYCNQEIYPVSAGQVYLVDGSGTDKLFLPRKINSIDAISVSADMGASQILTDDIDLDYIKLKTYHIIYEYGYRFGEGIQNVSVTGSFGFSEVPNEVIVATSLLVGKIWLPGLQDSLGKREEQIKDFKASYTKTLLTQDNYIEELLANYWRPTGFGGGQN